MKFWHSFEALSTLVLQALAHADTAAERRSLLQKLSESEISLQKLQAELSAESTAALNTSMHLNSVESHSLLLDKNVENLRLQMSKVSVDVAAIKSEKEWLKQLLSAEQRRVDKLERELAESSKAAALAVQVKKRWDQMEELEVKVHSLGPLTFCWFFTYFGIGQPEEGASESDLATNALKVKLQAALQEEMKLLERVQQLESDKVLLEERCSALQEGLSQMVHQLFIIACYLLVVCNLVLIVCTCRLLHMLSLQQSRDLWHNL